MGLFFTLLYILIAYLSPSEVFGPLAEFHVEVIVAALALLVSLPKLLRSDFLGEPQTLAIAGMSFAVFMSLLFSGWVGSAPRGLYAFFPNIFVFFLVVLHCRTKRHLQLIVLVLFCVCTIVMVHGARALQANQIVSPYIYDQGTGDGNHVLRIRGLGFLNDPNDYSQVLVSLIPLMFFFYRSRRLLLNAVLVFLPVAVLFVSLYLAHSRGAVIALVAITALSVRKKVGTVPALVVAGGIFVAASALKWTGGREISVESGEDRLDAWSTGLQMIKSHPIFGVGLGRFTEFYYITAHNSVIVCAAEIGLVGYFFWVLFWYSSIRNGVDLARATDKPKSLAGDESVGTSTEARPWDAPLVPSAAGNAPAPATWVANAVYASTSMPTYLAQRETFGSRDTPEAKQAEDRKEVGRLAGLLVISLAGYLVAGWFLSRAYVMTLFLYGGMIQSLISRAREGDFAPERLPAKQMLRKAGVVAVALITVVYIFLRIKKFLPG